VKYTGRKWRKIGIFGHFSDINFGNDSTFQALLYNLRRHLPDTDVTCICTDPPATTRLYNIDAVPMNGVQLNPTWLGANRAARLLRRVVIGTPLEIYRWLEAFRAIKGMDALIVAGTGLLTDSHGLHNWGPYNVFKWSLVAYLRGCRLLFVSVGAGPLHGRRGRWLIKSALRLATFRSYRDIDTQKYLNSIGLHTSGDRVYPDLAFSLQEGGRHGHDVRRPRRQVVGLGLMMYAGTLSVDPPSDVVYAAYLEALVVFVKWLLARDYDIRLLIGDISDRPVTQEFRELLKVRSVVYDKGRVIDEPVTSVDNLLSQLKTTDLVVATRYHNCLLALLLDKPVISISFHQKCASLMSDMGLSAYCQDIKQLDSDWLISQFCELEKNADRLTGSIKQKTEEFRKASEEQYSFIFRSTDACCDDMAPGPIHREYAGSEKES
jgi:polysaccharide pyruvyl transferase WcaK-like protein